MDQQGRRHGFLSGGTNRRQYGHLQNVDAHTGKWRSDLGHLQNALKIWKDTEFRPLHWRIQRTVWGGEVLAEGV